MVDNELIFVMSMNRRDINIVLVLLVFVAIVSFLKVSLFIVDPTQFAIVLQFGDPVRVIDRPGVYARVPGIQNVVLIGKMLEETGILEKEVIAADQKRIRVSAFVKYRVSNPVTYYISATDRGSLRNKLDGMLESNIRNATGKVPLIALLSDGRSTIMEDVQIAMSDKSSAMGIEIVDVRIMKSNLPNENMDAIYRRMKTQKKRQAEEIRAEGLEMSQKIRAKADREKEKILANAARDAENIKGQGDAESIRLLSNAASKDRDFFIFYRKLNAYKNAIAKSDKTIIMNPNDGIFNDLKGIK